MDYHHHARLTIYSREQLARSVVEGRLSLVAAAAANGLSRQSAGSGCGVIGRLAWQACETGRADLGAAHAAPPQSWSARLRAFAAGAGPECGSRRPPA